jgi:hypothetical protein
METGWEPVYIQLVSCPGLPKPVVQRLGGGGGGGGRDKNAGICTNTNCTYTYTGSSHLFI